MANLPSKGAVTPIADVPYADGIAVAGSNNPNQPPFLFVNRNDGIITKIDVSTSPPTLTDIVTDGTRGDFVTVGSDGCLYATQSTTVAKVTQTDGSCALAPTNASPFFLSLPFPHGPGETGLNRVYSFFDHEYPIYTKEPPSAASAIVRFDGQRLPGTIVQCAASASCYSGHDGYDFGVISDLLREYDNKVPVLAAAAGQITKTGTECGLPYIGINHGAYETVYYHLMPNDPNLRQSGHVNAGDRIGTIFVGARPTCTYGTHLHFGVYYDRNGDGQFQSDEVVDPYGFDPTKTDPWTLSLYHLKDPG